MRVCYFYCYFKCLLLLRPKNNILEAIKFFLYVMSVHEKDITVCVEFIVVCADPDGFSHKILRVALLVTLHLKIITIYGRPLSEFGNTFLLARRVAITWCQII